MSISINVNALPVPFVKALSATSATVVMDGTKGYALITDLVISNATGGAINITVDVYDGTTAWVIYPDTSLADVSVLTLADLGLSQIPLNNAWSLRVSGDTGIQVYGVYVRFENRFNSAAQNTL